MEINLWKLRFENCHPANGVLDHDAIPDVNGGFNGGFDENKWLVMMVRYYDNS